MIRKSLSFFLFCVFFTQSLQLDVKTAFFNKPPEEITEGLRDGRISNGWTAQENQFPFAVYLLFKWTNESALYYQSGVLLSSNWIATSVQYFIDFNTNTQLYEWIHVSGGSSERYSPFWQTTHVVFGAWHNPFNFDPISFPDFGVFRLQDHFPGTNRFTPVRLPRKSESPMNFFGHQVQITGWGFTDRGNSVFSTHLQYANFTVNFNPTVCGSPSSIPLPGYFICMTRGVNDASVQFGDEGAPILRREADGVMTVIGIVSLFDAVHNRIYGVNLSSFLDFIDIVSDIPIRS